MTSTRTWRRYEPTYKAAAAARPRRRWRGTYFQSWDGRRQARTALWAALVRRHAWDRWVRRLRALESQ